MRASVLAHDAWLVINVDHLILPEMHITPIAQIGENEFSTYMALTIFNWLHSIQPSSRCVTLHLNQRPSNFEIAIVRRLQSIIVITFQIGIIATQFPN